MAYKKRECIAIKKGERGWNAVAVLPEEYRTEDKDELTRIENFLSIRDGRDFYDFRIEPGPWYIWLKKKEIPFNMATSRKKTI